MSRQTSDQGQLEDYYTSYQAPQSERSPRLEPTYFSSPPLPTNTLTPPTSSYAHGTASSQARSLSRSPTRQGPRAGSKTPTHISTSRSRPNLPSTSRVPQRRDFKDLVTRFNQDEAPIKPLSTQERYRRAAQQQKPAKLMKPRSPTKPSHNKLQTRREPPNSRVPMSRLDTTRVLNASASHDGSMSSRSPKSPKRKMNKPLFGEVIYGPTGAEELGYGIASKHHARRGSESSIFKGAAHIFHVRSQSDAESPSHDPTRSSGDESATKHSRSRSDQTASFRHDSHQWTHDGVSDLSRFSISPYSSLPFLTIPPNTYQQPDMITTTPTRAQSQPRLHSKPSHETRARTPVSKYSRPPRAGAPPSPGRRGDSRRPGSPEKTLRANIIAPTTPKSPPLRSSRPRQPVSAASTASSRAKANERLAKVPKSSDEEGAKPRQRRKDPVLGRVDFAERRARIEKAISQNLDEKDFDRVSRASSTRRRSSASAASQIEEMINPDDGLSRPPITLEPVGENPKSPLFVDTHNISLDALEEPTTGETEFEEDDDSPDLAARIGPLADTSPRERSFSESIQNTPIEFSPHRNMTEPRTLFTEVLKYREGTSPATPETFDTAETTPTDENGTNQIRVKIDGKPIHIGKSPLANDVAPDAELTQTEQELGSTEHLQVETPADELTPNTPIESPSENFLPSDSDVTPRQLDGSSREVSFASTVTDRTRDSGETFMQRVIRDYERTGNIDPTLVAELERRGLDTHGTASLANGSDAQTIEILLDRFTYHPPAEVAAEADQVEEPQMLPSARFETGDRTSCTSQASADEPGYFESKPSPRLTRDEDGVDDFVTPAESMDAGEQLTSGRFGDETDHVTPGAESLDDGPTPPPKDERWSTGSSLRYGSEAASSDTQHLSPTATRFERHSQQSFSSQHSMSLPEIEVGGPLEEDLSFHEPETPPHAGIKPSPSPPAPGYAPPPPPPQPPFAGDGFIIEPQNPTEPPTPESPTAGAHMGLTNEGSLRPSEDSQRAGSSSAPPSQSMSSLAESTDRSSPAMAEDSKEPSPLQRRLAKRRNIIKELVDTEYSYHQDMKIIEDIYKATVGDLISLEDKKTLFGNADQIEALSLEFYDAIRRAVAPFYVPQKNTRWQTKRGSFGTSSSADRQAEADQPNEEQDKLTAVGAIFEQFLPRLEKVYGAYLKNHDAANKRLAVLQNDATVMCWLKECHNNASDITSAWDLDSLLVKPVQRILKYPLLLQQLLAVTPPEHPDHAALDRSVIESTNISQRINEAKRRADLVESIVHRKRKDSDMRSGLAKAFGLRTEKVKERIGIKNDFQDPVYEELSMKFGGHYVRLQVVMRDVQGSLTEVDRAVEKFNAFAMALESFIDVAACHYPEIESKWRKFILAIRELSNVALADHKAQVKKRVVDPMVMALRLHEGPQNVMAKRKKRVVDHVRCKQMEKSGQKPDKKTQEGSELYSALNEQLKIDLPKLYALTAQLIQRCLACHHQIQLAWLWTWEMKLRPVLDSFPETWEEILPEFHAEHDLVAAQVYSLGLCNGSLLHEASKFLSTQTSFATMDDPYRMSRPGGISSRTQSVGSEHAPSLQNDTPRTQSSAFGPTHNFYDANVSINGQMYSRARSSSNLSQHARGRATSVPRPDGQPTPRLPSQTPKSSFSGSRPPTASRPSDLHTPYNYKHMSADGGGSQRPSRPDSGTSYFSSSQQDQPDRPQRFSGLFSSAMPMSGGGDSPGHANGGALGGALAGIGMGIGGVAYPSAALGPQQSGSGNSIGQAYTTTHQTTHGRAELQSAPSVQSMASSVGGASQHSMLSQHSLPTQGAGLGSNMARDPGRGEPPMSPRFAPEDVPVLFVAASLFEFNIDRARREAGYPYLTYVQGEVFDVVAQKGELWLAKNQDDGDRMLGWIWEQHFVILGREG
ncbi:RhoGEF domain-containing protein 1 [Elsinoe australis]|uniref:RhoGEF domain-containing protein 1 n=1 Tax=Elsinoe australis TaxID=40998 RepID=A0A4U7B937_9PEZI|nr:RhoGEF domain-containing protein 1 [Elsinoe australis]